jgi:hypothetical protein
MATNVLTTINGKPFNNDGTLNLYIGCRAHNDAIQSIPNSTSTALTFNTEAFDTDAIHSTTTNTSRFTVPSGKGGKWRAIYKASYGAGGVGEKILFLNVNGADVLGSAVNRQDTPRGTLHGTMTLTLAAGDIVEARVFHATGAALNFGNTSADSGFMNWFEIEYLGT